MTRTEADVEKAVLEEYVRITTYGAAKSSLGQTFRTWAWGLANHQVRNRLQVEDAQVMELVEKAEAALESMKRQRLIDRTWEDQDAMAELANALHPFQKPPKTGA